MAEPLQLPPEQASPVVQALPSSQAAALLAYWQIPPEQLSSVQALLSLQTMGVFTQPEAGLQESSVQPS